MLVNTHWVILIFVWQLIFILSNSLVILCLFMNFIPLFFLNHSNLSLRRCRRSHNMCIVLWLLYAICILLKSFSITISWPRFLLINLRLRRRSLTKIVRWIYFFSHCFLCFSYLIIRKYSCTLSVASALVILVYHACKLSLRTKNLILLAKLIL
jgi:hypothetical protein